MSDDRPTPDEPARPQYGEYATPEQQRARMGLPEQVETESGGAEPASGSGVGDAGTGGREAAAWQRSQHPAPMADSTASRARSGAVVDRVVTWVMLALGLVTVLSLAPGLFTFDRQLEATLALFDIDEPLADPAGARTWGLIGAIVLIVGYLGTALFAWWWMRRGHLAFWIPLVGAAVTIIIVSMCTNVPVLDDPAFEQLTNRILGVSIG